MQKWKKKTTEEKKKKRILFCWLFFDWRERGEAKRVHGLDAHADELEFLEFLVAPKIVHDMTLSENEPLPLPDPGKIKRQTGGD